jgi:hypothetical protein
MLTISSSVSSGHHQSVLLNREAEAMASRPDIFSFDSWVSAESFAAEQHVAFGICEVISIGACDELPYVFEISGGQKLSFSLTASHEVDLVLCDEPAYDKWVDGGLQTEHPTNAILMLRHACQHSLEFRPEQDTTLIAIIINLADRPVQSVVAANILDSAGRPC